MSETQPAGNFGASALRDMIAADHQTAQADYRLRADSGRVLTGAAKEHAEAAANAEDAASVIALAGGLEQVARKLGRDRAIALAVRAGHGQSTLVQNWLHEQAKAEANTAERAARLQASYAADPMHDPRVIGAITSGASDAELARVVAEVTAERSGLQPKVPVTAPPVPVAWNPLVRLAPGTGTDGERTRAWLDSHYAPEPGLVTPADQTSVSRPESGGGLPDVPVASAAPCHHIGQAEAGRKFCGECGTPVAMATAITRTDTGSRTEPESET